jgi:hypothetical protein
MPFPGEQVVASEVRAHLDRITAFLGCADLMLSGV